jgi:SAM-dependent methyltransferase
MTSLHHIQEVVPSTLDDWKKSLLNTESFHINNYLWQNDCLVKKQFAENIANNSDEVTWNHSFFSNRATIPYTTSQIETTIFKDKLHQFLSTNQIPKDAHILDLGCSDGRATKIMLELGYTHIVATDIAQAPVNSLYQNLSNEERERVFLIIDDVNELPLKYNSFDVVIAWGVFTSTPDFSQALSSALSHLKPGGLLLNAEPVIESTLVYALVRQDLEEFEKTFKTGTRASSWEDKTSRYKVFSRSEIEHFMTRPQLNILSKDGISIFPSLVFGGVCQNQPVNESNKAALQETLLDIAKLTSEYPRQVIYVSQKILGL